MTPTKDEKGAKSAKPAKPAAEKKAAPARAAAPKAAAAGSKQTVTVRQLRRAIDAKQRLALQGLGLRRIRHSVSHDDSVSVRGMIAKVVHVLSVTREA